LAFLTPVGGARAPDASAVAWFPLAGAIVGAAVGLAWQGADAIWAPAVAAAVAVAADVVLTGALHLDGLADSADGLLPHLDRDRRLAVMAEPAVGAFGVTTLVAVLLLRFAAFTAVTPSVPLVAGLWSASRAAMAVTVRAVPYARPDGLARAFLGGPPLVPAALGGAVALPLALAGAGASGALAVLAVALAAAGVVAWAGRRIGGFTGDVLGAAGVVGETAGLLVVAAW
jgi:adenosylcobinamide-GDP ribazoletransferase